ncbi:LysR family transcriptional regulator [Nocardioides sp. TRM66260-LWL]|uniref:LysR family transcriptional regulator n=1 Tax=Nocardioides sp. TRM66260-LWL TaxID=2874478 RepID=UPI001CC38582|nr:LysR family transcriptional regulator [Nocardioides sp. TRM66260-LWL]MBZ5734222.1 LysR family transcriptional regulator [Nocardioides sp. TRM66260-LWL]
MIDVIALASLRAVAEHGSVVAAADALALTPSAVSQQIKRLERQAGTPLLERAGRGVVLTGPGRHLAEEGGRVLADLEALEASVRRGTGRVAGTVRLVAFSTAVRGIVAPVVRSLLDRHPELRIRISEREPWDAVDDLAGGRADLGLVHRWGEVPLAVPDHLAVTPVAADVADVVLRRDHRLAGRASVSPHDLVDEWWISTPPGTICRQWLGRMHDGTGRPPRVAHESWEFASHLALAAAGLGIALVPRLGRGPLDPDLRAVPVTDPVPTRTIDALHRRSMGGSPALGAVLGALVEAGAAQPSIADSSGVGSTPPTVATTSLTAAR